MISKISIENFKSFALKKVIPLTALNIISGGNSAGKTTILEALLVAAQSEEHDFLNGSMKYLGEFNNIKNNQSQEEFIEIELDVDDHIYQYRFNNNHTMVKDIEKIPLSIHYLSAERIGIRDIYEKNRKYNYFSSKGEELVSLLNQYKDDRGLGGKYAKQFRVDEKIEVIENLPIFVDNLIQPREGVLSGNESFLQIVNIWMKILTGYEVGCQDIENTNYIKLFYIKDSNEYKPQHIGTGVTFVLFQIIAALVSSDSDLLIVENPEIHLHPSLQSYLMYFYLWLSRQGKQIIIETHSDHLFNAGRYYKSRGEECNILFICLEEEIDGEGNSYLSSKVNFIEVGEMGEINNDQPGLFDQYVYDLEKMMGF